MQINVKRIHNYMLIAHIIIAHSSDQRLVFKSFNAGLHSNFVVIAKGSFIHFQQSRKA
jgi:hypothetical protein